MTPLEMHLRKWMEKAVLDFGMIEPGDGVAVAVSGGKDSLALLKLLAGPLVHVTRDFRLLAVHIDAGIPGSDPDALARHFEQAGVDYRIVPATHIFGQSQSPDAGKRPCYVCSRLRRRALAEAAVAAGCSKIALAHHLDDAVETTVMNMCFNREISTMLPAQRLFDGSVTLIRPLYYIREKRVAKFAAQSGLPVLKTRCPAEDVTRRKFVKDTLAAMAKHDPHVYGNIFRSAFRVKPEYLPSTGFKIELPKDF